MAQSRQPLVINRWTTGLITRRNQLLTPLQSMGLNVISRHDALIDGLNMEVSDNSTLQRRPGFSRYCNIALAENEFPVSYYSFRNLSGQVFPIVDTNQNIYTFTANSLTLIWPKTTSAQTHFQTVGNTLYFTDGAEQKKWDGNLNLLYRSQGGFSVSPWGTNQATVADNNVADPNGGMTASTLSGAVVNGDGYVYQNVSPVPPGQTIIFSVYMKVSSGTFTTNLYLAHASGSPYTTAFTNLTTTWQRFTITYAVPVPDTSIRVIIGGNSSIPLGKSIQIWGAQIQYGNTVTSYQPTTTAAHGLTSWGMQAPIITPILQIGGGWVASTHFSVNAIIVDSNGSVEQCTVAGTTGTSIPTWPAQGSTVADGGATWKNLGGPSQAWLPNSVFPQFSIIVDSNFNLQYAVNGGTSGSSTPNWSAALNAHTIDGTINYWLNLGQFNGLTAQSGYSYVYVFHSYYGHSSTASPATGFTGSFTNSILTIIGDGTADPQCDTIDIYRTADGGSVYYYLSSLPNPGAGQTWEYADSQPDAFLDNEVIAPLAHENDPPVTGMGVLAFYQGRIWGAVGNNVYFDGGPDILNGIAEEAWPPANVFTFPGNVNALCPTTAGLAVFTNDCMYAIQGGPQTLSYYDQFVLGNFGIASPNAIAQDGDQIYLYTTSRQYFSMNTQAKNEDGFHVGNLLAANFDPAKTYVTLHRSGEDTGVFLSDGSTNVIRYSLNQQAWSPLYQPAGGCMAIDSIEVTPGEYQLLLGRQTPQGYILNRDLDSFADDGAAYPASATIGSITLSEPGADAVPVENILGYFSSPGSDPSVSLIANEISGTFTILPNHVPEPPTGARPSTSLKAYRYSLRQNTQAISQMIHHMQIKIDFPSEALQNELLTLAINFNN